MYKIAQTVTVEKLYDEFTRTANDNDKNTDLCGDINRIDTNETSSPVHLHSASSSVSPQWIMQNSVQMVALRVEPRGPKHRCWANQHGRWVKMKLFPLALLVCKLSRRSSDLGGADRGGKNGFHAICGASHAFSSTARGLCGFFSNRDKPWPFVCFTL